MDDAAKADLEVRIGEEIQHLRLHSGLSQADLGAAAGLTQSQLQGYEAGRGSLTVARLVAIADALHTDPAHFLRVRRPAASVLKLFADAAADAVGPISQADVALAVKIGRIRADAGRRDVIASIDRLADAMMKSDEPMTVSGVTAGL